MSPDVSRQGTAGRTVAMRVGAAIRNSRAAARILSTIPRDGCVVLRYHSVNDDPGWADDYIQSSLAVPPDVFERQMRFLKDRHEVVGIGDIAEMVRSGRRMDGRLAVVTFDDGYEDNYRNALPILTSHGLTAAFYVTSGTVADAAMLWTVNLRFLIRNSRRDSLRLSFANGRVLDTSSERAKENAIRFVTAFVKRCAAADADRVLSEVEEECGTPERGMDRRVMMNENELRELRAAGMIVGAHTVGHYNLPSLATDKVASEVADSRSFLEEVLGSPVLHMAYPNGRTRHFDGRVARVVAEQGFSSAVTSVGGPVSRACSVFSLPRLGVAPRHRDVARLEADIQYARLTRARGKVFDDVRSATRAFEDHGGRADDTAGARAAQGE